VAWTLRQWKPCDASRRRYHPLNLFDRVDELEVLDMSMDRGSLPTALAQRENLAYNESLVVISSVYCYVIVVSFQHEPSPVLVRRLGQSDVDFYSNCMD